MALAKPPRKRTEKVKLLMSLSRKGSNNPHFGQKHSEETKELMRKSKTGRKLSEGRSLATPPKDIISSTLGHETYLYKLLDTSSGHTILSKIEIENSTFKLEKNKEIHNEKIDKYLLDGYARNLIL